MHEKENIFTKAETVSLKTVDDMVKFALGTHSRKGEKPDDISLYVDYEKGWKFMEEDKEFLVAYYEGWIKGCIEEYDGDFVEQPAETLKSIKEKGVNASKDLIQGDAREMADAVCGDVYQYYAECPETLKLIENSILDVQWEV